MLTVNPGFVHTEGFPNRDVLPGWMRPLVVEADDVAEHVLRALERGRRETFVPGWYRVAAIAQAVAPGAVAALLSRARYRTIRDR